MGAKPQPKAARKLKVLAPNEAYNGVSAGVTFVKGEGEVDSDNHAALAYFSEAGYQIEK